MTPALSIAWSTLSAFFILETYAPLFFLHKKRNHQTLQTYPPISVILPVKNEGVVLKKIVRSWLSISYPSPFEIIIADAGSTDGTQQIARTFAKENSHVVYVRLSTNNKFNTVVEGIKKARYDTIVLSDSDRLVNADAIIRLMPYMTKGVGAVFGIAQVVKNDSAFQKLSTLEYLNIMTDLLFYSAIDSAPYLYLHACIINKNLIDDVPHQQLTADDLYLGLHIRKKGYRSVCIPDVEVGHEQVINISDIIKKRLRTSGGTGEIARSNYLHMMFQKKYGLFGMVVLPFRHATTIVANMLTVIGSLLTVPVLFSGITNTLVVWAACVYVLLTAGQFLRYAATKQYWEHTYRTVPVWTFFLYPFYYLVVRKFFAGAVFMASLSGVKFAWKKTRSDRAV